MKKIAVFFPGIGYSVEKPLLYYTGKMVSEMGYEIRQLSYSGFPDNIRGDQSGMVKAYVIALKQAQAELAEVNLGEYDEILFAAKSIGTIVAATIAGNSPQKERIRLILFTPLEQTFMFGFGDAAAFTGTADPWVDGADSRILDLCRDRGIPCFAFEGANHSLETGDWKKDLENLRQIMKETEAFIENTPM